MFPQIAILKTPNKTLFFADSILIAVLQETGEHWDLLRQKSTCGESHCGSVPKVQDTLWCSLQECRGQPHFDILPLTPGGPWSHTFGLDQVLLCPISNPTLGQSSPQVPELWVAPMSEQHWGSEQAPGQLLQRTATYQRTGALSSPTMWENILQMSLQNHEKK